MIRANHQFVKFTQNYCQKFFILYNMRQAHKGGCYGPPSQYNLSQIQNAQLPKSRPCHLQFLRLPRFFFTSPIQGCDLYGPANATHMQPTCNTHATHMQHTCNTSIFPVNFQAKWPRGQKSIIFHSKTRVGAANVKPSTLTVNLQVKSPCYMSCYMCVTCVLHV